MNATGHRLCCQFKQLKLSFGGDHAHMTNNNAYKFLLAFLQIAKICRLYSSLSSMVTPNSLSAGADVISSPSMSTLIDRSSLGVTLHPGSNFLLQKAGGHPLNIHFSIFNFDDLKTLIASCLERFCSRVSHPKSWKIAEDLV